MTSHVLSEAPPCAAPLTRVKLPRHSLPPNACDSHLHIVGPAQVYPYVSDRVYTPPDCLLADYQVVRGYLGVDRCVLVQPSVYGDDNRVLLAALWGLGEAARGVVVLRGDESHDDLARMHEWGVRGVRVNLVDLNAPRPEIPRDHLLHLAEMIGQGQRQKSEVRMQKWEIRNQNLEIANQETVQCIICLAEL